MNTTLVLRFSNNEMFGGDDIIFDLQLESFGVEMGPLREPVVKPVFRAWVEDWEEEAQTKNDCVAEAQLLAKHKGLVFRDPNSEKSFLIWEQNMEFCRERGNGLFLVAVCADDDDDKNETFSLETACILIAETPEKDGIQVVHQ